MVRLAGVDKRGDPVLADGRSLRLVGLAPRQDEAEASRFAAAIDLWRERDLGLVTLASPDRWGRLASRLLAAPASPGEPAIDLAKMLLGAGAAKSLPEAAYPACDTPAPAAAKAALASVSASDVVDGHDVAALRAQAGRIVLVQGRIASVGERPQRTYLNFSRRRGEGGAIMLSRKLWQELRDAGWTTAALTGRRVQARGVLGGQDGLLLELGSRAALELID